MKAAVADRPGSPEVLRVREVPRPQVRPGWTLVEVKAFGLNRSELMTRQGRVRLDEIVEAHRYMEANRATGKVVATTG